MGDEKPDSRRSDAVPDRGGAAGAVECAGSEAELVTALRAGSPEAFEQLVREQGPRLLAVARRMLRNEQDARDCVQEAFLAAHRAVGDFEGRSRLGTWLHRVVTNAALMRLRARRSRPEETIDEFEPTYDRWGFREGPTSTNEFTPEQLLQRAGTRKLVREAIDRLPESYRTVLLLRDIEGFTTQETAELLSASSGVVKVRLHRARTALRRLLEPLFEEDLR